MDRRRREEQIDVGEVLGADRIRRQKQCYRHEGALRQHHQALEDGHGHFKRAAVAVPVPSTKKLDPIQRILKSVLTGARGQKDPAREPEKQYD